MHIRRNSLASSVNFQYTKHTFQTICGLSRHEYILIMVMYNQHHAITEYRQDCLSS